MINYIGREFCQQANDSNICGNADLLRSETGCADLKNDFVELVKEVPVKLVIERLLVL